MRLRLGLVGLLAVALVGPLAAQPAPTTRTDEQQQRRDRIKQRVRAIRAYMLTEQLSLDEATAAKLFPALAKYDEESDRLLAARAALQKRLAGAAAMKDAKAVDKLLDEAIANQKALWDAEARRLEQLRNILTPAQVARTLIVLPAMERRILNQLRKATKKTGTAPPGAVHPELDDPFEDAPKPAKKKPAAKAERCDPFATVRGCNTK